MNSTQRTYIQITRIVKLLLPFSLPKSVPLKEIRVQGTSRETPAAIDLLPLGMRVSKTLGRGRGRFLDSVRVVAQRS